MSSSFPDRTCRRVGHTNRFRAAVESACKTVVNQRLCLGGMRWGAEGSDAVAHLRALYRSDPEQWEAFWATAA